MTRTRPSTLVVLGVIGAALGWLLEFGLVALGRAVAIPPVTRVSVTVHKPSAPITVPFADVSVTIERSR